LQKGARSRPFTNSLQDVKTKFPKLTETDLCDPPLNKIGKGNGSMSIAQVIAMVVVIVLSACAGSVVSSARFTDPVKSDIALSDSGSERY
jgi:hypothetical protein